MITNQKPHVTLSTHDCTSNVYRADQKECVNTLK